MPMTTEVTCYEAIAGGETALQALSINKKVAEVLEDLVSRTASKSDLEGGLNSLEKASAFLAWHHSGVFFSPRLEGIARDLSERLSGLEIPWEVHWLSARSNCNSSPRILHFTTRLGDIGGHSRFILNLIHNTQNLQHCVVSLTEMASNSEWIVRELHSLKVPVGSLGHQPLLSRLVAAAKLFESGWDLVLLYLLPSDSVGCVAAHTARETLAMVNHTDHCFWVGRGLKAHLINIRHSADRLARERRLYPNTHILPIPLEEKPIRSLKEYRAARERLGINPGDFVLVTMGRSTKYRPVAGISFLHSVENLLRHIPQTRVFVIGLTRRDVERWGVSIPSRLHLLGPIVKPEMVIAAADCYVESFPIGSLTALLEAAQRGVACVGAPTPVRTPIVSDDPALDNILPCPVSEEEWITTITSLARDREWAAHLGTNLARSVHSTHVGDGWRAHWNEVCNRILNSTVESTDIPEPPHKSDYIDLFLALLSLGEKRRTHFFGISPSLLSEFTDIGPINCLRALQQLSRFMPMIWTLRAGKRALCKTI